MKIDDYLKIAKEYTMEHHKDNDFILMGLYKLIQETDLKKLHAHSLVSQQGDGSYILVTPQEKPLGNHSTTLTVVTTDRNGTKVFSVDKDQSNGVRDILFGLQDDHDLIRRFNNDLQHAESLFDLKDIYTFDEITRIKHLTTASVSLGLALELISQNDESFETGKYNVAQNSYLNQISIADDSNYNKSPKFMKFSGDALSELISTEVQFPLTPEGFFDNLNVTAQSKIIDISGFGHINFIQEDFQDLIDNDSPFIHDSFVGSLFKVDSLRDAIISYFHYNEFDDIKFEFDLMADQFLSRPTIEHLLENDSKFEGLNDMLMEVYNKHPEINYSMQDIKIISDNEIAVKGEVIEHQVDKFHLFESARDINDLGPSQNNRREFLGKYKLYGNDILKDGEERIRFISSNQFAADAILSGNYYVNDRGHNEISIDSMAINPQLSNEHIHELFNSVVDYAEKNKCVVMFSQEKASPWGGINKDRMVNMINEVSDNAIDRVPILCNFGVSGDRHHFALNYLVNTDCSYKSLPKLLHNLKTFIDSNPTLDDLQLELKMDEFIVKERLKLKSDMKASI